MIYNSALKEISTKLEILNDELRIEEIGEFNQPFILQHDSNVKREYTYFYLFLKSKGLLENEIGAICALTPIITLACNPFWNHLSKNANTNRNIMRVITVLEGIFIILYDYCCIFIKFYI